MEIRAVGGLVGERVECAKGSIVVPQPVPAAHELQNRGKRSSVEQLRGQVDASVTRIINVAGKILEKPITPPLASEEAVATVDVNDLLQERLGQLWAGEDYAAVTLRRELDGPPLLARISPEWFRRAVDIVVANAVKAMRAAPTRRLTVSARPVPADAGDQVEITFRDTGPGIPPAGPLPRRPDFNTFSNSCSR